jgi:SAM-dependent methyltransferase
MFPATAFRPLQASEVEILVAGCGTGRHAIEAAEMIAGSRLLAVDLSLGSLCYALRMTRKFGVDNVEYAQANLLKLGPLGRTFDLVVAGGVLHHLADPFGGWRALLHLLRPAGFMHLGLYSRIARTDITAGRAFVAERGYAPTPKDIRRCRQDLLEADDPELAGIARMTDFFTTSECRDLLFHVQEHCFSVPDIKNFLRENELDFLGFKERADVRGRYSRMFPEDVSMTNLDNWEIFENEHPDTFRGMYEFWVQKGP